jgi:hypothetical protein
MGPHMDFTALEREALTALAKAWSTAYPGLTEQIKVVECARRTNTGGGFFTELTVKRSGVSPLSGRSPINDHYVRVDGMSGPIGLILFFEDGYLNLLEGYAVAGDDTSRIDFTTARFGPISTWENVDLRS